MAIKLKRTAFVIENISTMRAFLRVGAVLLCLQLLSACENKVNHTSVSVDSNAYYAVYQKDLGEAWKTVSYDNTDFGFETITFNVDGVSSPYSVVFVCPSSRVDRPHEVFIFHTTPAEIKLLDFKCRKVEEDIVQKALYGEVLGVQMASSTNPQGEMAVIGVSKDVSIGAHEAYASLVKGGSRDFVAMKGKLQGIWIGQPEVFYIKRSVNIGLSLLPFTSNVDFTGNDIGVTLRNFNEAERTTININNTNAGDVLDANIGFLSRNKTFLELAKSQQPNFSFVPVPLDEYTQPVDGFVNAWEFYPGEGHELKIQTYNAEGKVSRQFWKLFTKSDASKNITVNLPTALGGSTALALQNDDDLQSIIVNWNAYSDFSVGNTGIYQWTFQGLAAPYEAGLKPTVVAEHVKWIVTVTPGWLASASRSSGNYTLLLPTNFNTLVKDFSNNLKNGWRKEWGFRASSPVDWELAAITISNGSTAEDVVNYLLNRKFQKGFEFTQSYTRSTIKPN